MKVSISWLKELVDLKVPMDELIQTIPMKTIGLKEVTDEFFELDMKGYNRADLLSMRGVAKEIAATTDSKVKFSNEELKEYQLPSTNVQVEDPKLCPVYCIAKIEGLKAESSPKAWVQKLEQSGMRTVNNIADITNLIMLEFGQPMHSFDAGQVKEETLIVRKAHKDETIQTLDGKERSLNESDLVIADTEKALGIAGVMGDKSSEASDKTTSILLEAAIFDPVSIRRSAQRHGLYSEASKRFQHGLTKTNLLEAFAKAIKMYEQMGGKLTAISFTSDLKDEINSLNLRPDRVRKLVGIDISDEEIKDLLGKLGFKVQEKHPFNIEIPYWRLDIKQEEDLIEEVARMYGYNKIPPQELTNNKPEKIDQRLPDLIYDLKKRLVEIGLTEVQTYSFLSTDVINNLDINREELIRVANPISSETEYMRQNIWQNLMEVVAKNFKKYSLDDIAIFEIGKGYFPKSGDMPVEEYRLGIALMNGSDNPTSELYQILKKMSINLELGGTEKSPTDEIMFHPTRFQHLKVDNQIVGGIAEVHPGIANKFGLDKRVAIAEIILEKLPK